MARNKKIFTPEQSKGIKQLLFYGLVYGALLNYSLTTIFNLPFYWWGFPAYGVLLYFIKSELLDLWKDLWFKVEQ